MIHTAQQQRNINRRLDRINAGVDAALSAMRDGGLALHLSFTSSGPRWCLANGRLIPAEVAIALINCGRIVGVGDALFEGVSQTWRYVE
jgi:hypothetical protein